MQIIIKKLKEIGAVKTGSFVLKSGKTSSVYLDLRLIISYPQLVKEITEKLGEKIEGLSFDYICGVPYTALPLSTALSLKHDLPMVLVRKEKKEHGTKKMVEGVFEVGKRCLLIEDVITSGMSILETIKELKAVGLEVCDVVVIVNREAGGVFDLEAQGIKVHTLTTLSEILSYE